MGFYYLYLLFICEWRVVLTDIRVQRGARTTVNESISCHSEGAKRLKNLKLDPSGIALRMTRSLDFHSNEVSFNVLGFEFYLRGKGKW